MKRPNKKMRNFLINGSTILITVALVVWIGAQSGDIGASWDALFTANPLWIAAAFGCWCVYILSKATILITFFRQHQLRLKLSAAVSVALIGQYYSNITPSSSGGQGMQIYALRKRGYPTGISTSLFAVKFFCYQSAVLLSGILMWITHPHAVSGCIGGNLWIPLLGFFVNGVAVGVVVLLAINRNIVRALIILIINIGHKIHIVHDKARTSSKADAALNDFHNSVDMLTAHPFRMLVLFLLSCITVASLMTVCYCVYRALGLSGVTFGYVLTVQLMLSIGASFTPLPGGSGAQEGGFYLFFRNIIPAEMLLTGLLLWRFFTYYISIIVGLIAVIEDSARSMRQSNRKQAEDNSPDQPVNMNDSTP